MLWFSVLLMKRLLYIIVCNFSSRRGRKRLRDSAGKVIF